MSLSLVSFLLALAVMTATGLLAPGPAAAQSATALPGRLVSTAWLQDHLARKDLLVIDASSQSAYKKGHIPGAINADLFILNPREVPLPQMEARLRSWGIDAQTRIVITDPGGTYMATRLFWDLVQHGLPAEHLAILDGGMARWTATGGPVTAEATPPRPAGTVRVTARDPEVRVRLPEFLAATADPQRHVMLEALDPEYFYGGAAFFDRGGHVPHATLMPAGDFYNADKTFKSPQDIQRQLDHLGIRRDQQVLTYCGGGGAAAVPFFALKYLLGYPQVKLFQESQLGWLQDERQLPVWTYADPQLLRDAAAVKAWASPMLKAFGLSQVTVVDVRLPEAFKLGHVPLALNVPVQALDGGPDRARHAATVLGQAGLDRNHEAVVVSEGGLSEPGALAFLMLENAGQRKASILLDSIDRWAEQGNEVARPSAPGQPTAKPVAYAAPASGLRIISEPGVAQSAVPRVFVASDRQAPQRAPAGRVIHLPYPQFLNADGSPKAAKEIWSLMSKAGVPRYAQIVLFADTPGAAAVNYVIFRLMGFADLKVWVP
jgi:3-mercaptopyruvate sulfurtransferase SseA